MIVQLSLLVAISVFGVNLGAYFGCVTLVAGYFLVLLLLSWLKPYNSKIAGAVATRGALCVFFTSFSSLLFLPAGTISGQADAYEQYAVAVGEVVLCMNFAHVVSVAWQVCRVVAWKDVGGKMKGAIGRLVGVHRVGGVRRVAGVQEHAAPAEGLHGKSSDSV